MQTTRPIALLTLFFTLLCSISFGQQQQPVINDISVSDRSTDQDFPIQIQALSSGGTIDEQITGTYQFGLNDETVDLEFTKGIANMPFDKENTGLFFFTNPTKDLSFKLYHISPADDGLRMKHLPLWLSLLPPLLAIVLALIFKEVLISLFSGIFLGAFIVNGLSISSIPISFLQTIDKYAIGAMLDSGHASIIIFSLMIGGMVAVISRNGGMQGVVNILSRYAKSKRSAQLVTWFLGVAIFFDDYANTLIVGNTMRPVSDKFKISREKLSYLVDSTAAPVASIAFITTWIGAELGYIGDAIAQLGLDDQNAYSMFMGSLEYAYYPIFTLVFMLFIIFLQRDFGAMHTAELKADVEGQHNNSVNTDSDELKAMEVKAGIEPKAINAILPIVTVVLMVLVGLVYTGWDADVIYSDQFGFIDKLSTTFGNADSYRALLWASLSGMMVALVMTVGGRLMSIAEAMETTVKGFQSLLIAMLILVTAWSLATITEELHTANFLTSLMVGNVDPFLMPTITFLLAAGVSFSTGSSWSTMAILFPILLPTTYTLCMSEGLDHETSLSVMYNVIAVIMGGSVFGDHCSPISDTTILSSLASGCNHIDHVRTQIPYALTVGLVSILVGGIFFYLNVPWYLEYLLGFVVLYLIVRYVGKPYPALVKA